MVTTRSQSTASTSSSRGKPWRKVLYERQPFPDNYSGEQFLSTLQTNVTAVHYTYGEAVVGASHVVHQLALFVLHAALFEHINAARVNARFLLGSATLLMILVVAYTRKAKQCVTYVLWCWGMTPLLQTLTTTVSSDTIYAMVVGMALVHMLTHNYGSDAPTVSPAISLNAAIFATVCLMSRLNNQTHAFTLLVVALTLFVGWPYYKVFIVNKIGQWCKSDHVMPLITALLTLCALLNAYCAFGFSSAAYFTIIASFIAFVCPAMLMLAQPLKSTIHGPWDEARIRNKAVD